MAAWQREAETLLASGPTSAQFEIAQTLTNRLQPHDAERFAFLLAANEADARIGGAWLALHALKKQ